MPSAEDIIDTYFTDARTATAATRRFGLEVETLFVDEITRKPMSLAASQRVLRRLVERGGWRVPTSFNDLYKSVLTRLRCYVNREDDHYWLLDPPVLLAAAPHVDLDLFVTYVWWWTRLRVRRGQLVLEVRAIPRRADASLAVDVQEIVSVLAM